MGYLRWTPKLRLYIRYYNQERLHQDIDYLTPMEKWRKCVQN